MKIIDLHDPSRVDRTPDGVEVLLQSGNFIQDGYRIQKVELRYYLENVDPNLGPYSLITSFIETDKGSIETIYDEGYRGQDSLKRTAAFLTSNLGISALILRSIISLREHTNDSNA